MHSADAQKFPSNISTAGQKRKRHKYIPGNKKINVLQSEKEREIFPQEELLTSIPKQRKWEIDGAASLLHNLIFTASLWKVGCQSVAVFSHKWRRHQFSLSDTNRLLLKSKSCAKPPQKSRMVKCCWAPFDSHYPLTAHATAAWYGPTEEREAKQRLCLLLNQRTCRQRCHSMLAEKVQVLANPGLSGFWVSHIYLTLQCV